jgi:hypothetical protein
MEDAMTTKPTDRLARLGQPSLAVPLAISFVAVIVVLAVAVSMSGA